MTELFDDLDQFYPGSRTKRKDPAKQPANQMVVILPELGESHIYRVGGEDREFFFIGQLARALNRSAVTLRRWEAQAIIPQPTYSAPSYVDDPRGRRRIYSREQVEGIVRIAAEEGLLDPLKRVNSTNFSARVTELFRELAK